MKFIREMIQRKTQSSSLEDAIDADLHEMRQDGGANTARVPDFTDLVADINPPVPEQPESEPKIVETDDEILALFDQDDDEEWENDAPETLEADPASLMPEAAPEIEEFVGDVSAEAIAFDGPESDADEQDYEDEVYEEDLYEEIAETTAAEPVEVATETTSRNIWDMNTEQEDEIEVVAETPEPQIEEPAEPVVVQVPTPAIGRAGRRAGRVKTRLLGFEHAGSAGVDMFAAPDNTETKPDAKFPVGWIVISQGPGRGASFSLFNGV
ncbi:MAG: hypothetical protein ACU0CA_17920, partial [Paracoccaceae bacterium]